MLERPKDGELPKAEEIDRLLAGETVQAPDVKPICQRSPIILPQSVDILEHADNGCGNSGLVVAEKVAEDEVCSPLMISQLSRGLVLLPPQEVPQIPNPQGKKSLTLNGIRVIDAQNFQSLETRYRFTRGNPTPKANTQVLRWKVPM